MEEIKEELESKVLYVRIAISPIVFVLGILMMVAGTIVPLFILIGIYSFVGFFTTPFIYILKKGGSKIKYFDPYIGDYEDDVLLIMGNHLLGITLYFWAPFEIVYTYIKTGRIPMND